VSSIAIFDKPDDRDGEVIVNPFGEAALSNYPNAPAIAGLTRSSSCRVRFRQQGETFSRFQSFGGVQCAAGAWHWRAPSTSHRKWRRIDTFVISLNKIQPAVSQGQVMAEACRSFSTAKSVPCQLPVTQRGTKIYGQCVGRPIALHRDA